MKKLYATLFSALFLGGAICASCTDKKDASAEEVINTIHKVNNCKSIISYRKWNT